MCFSTPTPTRLAYSSSVSGKSPSSVDKKKAAKPTLRKPLSVKTNLFNNNSNNKPSSLRQGRWIKEERLNFLLGLRRYGRGNWKKIATLIPTRGTIQTKTHAQVIMKKYDAGENIFEELDSFERRFISEQDELKLVGSGTARNYQEMTTPTFVWKPEDFESAKILVLLKSDPTTRLF